MKRILYLIVALFMTLIVSADDTWQYILSKYGYDPATVTDLTESAKIRLAEPYRAYVNITGISQMPTTKTQDLQAWLECYDGSGNYFKKRVILNAQGNSSLEFPKKNISVKFYEENWGEGKTTDITFGNWVKQDAFHLKAYYTDYFRGCGKIAYDIYDDITSDRENPLPWQRAGVTTASNKAMCHPNGFPCYVYLNGKFYGLFVWSLKKNHKNMGQEKDNALHIHIDGTIGDETITNGKINWKKFEVRTPKDLLCVDTIHIGGTPTYKLYDGDKPTELIDESMPYYDSDNPDHVLTNKVKQSLTSLSLYPSMLRKLDAVHTDSETFLAQYSQYFDTQGIIDYLVHSLVTNNYDGHWKNWQWFTYDGVKWFIEPYDLDCTFGLHASGAFLLPPEWYNHLGVLYNQIPANSQQKLYLKHFPNVVGERYITLREKGIINADRYISYFKDWQERIGNIGYEMEYTRWPNSPCLMETTVNPNWTTEDNWENYYNFPDYSPETTYYAGNRCKLSNRIWTATATTKGIRPYKQIGQIDSQERVESWIRERISLLDEYFNYDPDGIKEVESSSHSDNQTVSHKVIRDNHLYIIRNDETYSVDGKRLK